MTEKLKGKEVGFVKAIYRYPVKSMGSEKMSCAVLGWHGIEGDRRFAFRRVSDKKGFPWLTAGKLPGLIRYQPVVCNENANTSVDEPTHVVTPSGKHMELRSVALQDELSSLHKSEVELFQLNHGMFDEAMLSVINSSTINEIEKVSGYKLDPRRFRPNILLETTSSAPFQEDSWVGNILVFGKESEAPAMSVALRDVRCAMINLDPDTGVSSPEILKTAVRINQNNAGVYGSTFRSGTIELGVPVYLVSL